MVEVEVSFRILTLTYKFLPLLMGSHVSQLVRLGAYPSRVQSTISPGFSS